MQSENRIHLVTHGTPHAAAKVSHTQELDPKEIVRETLTVARECEHALVGSDLKKDQLLIDLVASLVIVRLRKAGAR